MDLPRVMCHCSFRPYCIRGSKPDEEQQNAVSQSVLTPTATFTFSSHTSAF
jgi:hypothetical protein